MSAKIYAAIYVKNNKEKIKEDLEAHLLRENIITKRNYDNIESVHMFIPSCSENNLYHLHLEVQENESERVRDLLYTWLNKQDEVQMHIVPHIEQ